ncbi:hypothetical protein Vafri_17011 [Volvox africanus]|uniref:Tr-type G domain-containing protein n=1 Tax=Volvox africanus TaxID=51714 RepID=A0A8J4BK34_9CHLO|nr:hypothetical protein Vafri_17011 [Volvox africanus]
MRPAAAGTGRQGAAGGYEHSSGVTERYETPTYGLSALAPLSCKGCTWRRRRTRRDGYTQGRSRVHPGMRKAHDPIPLPRRIIFVHVFPWDNRTYVASNDTITHPNHTSPTRCGFSFAAKPDPSIKALQQPAYLVTPHLALRNPQQQQQSSVKSTGATVTDVAVDGSSTSGGVEPFRFDTPSPDDVVRDAQERRGGAIPPPQPNASAAAVPSLSANKNYLRPSPMMQKQRQQQHQKPGMGAEAAAGGVAALSLGPLEATQGSLEAGAPAASSHGASRHHHHHQHVQVHEHAGAGAGSSGTSHGNALEHPGGFHGLHTRRPVKEYVLEAELERDVEAAAAAEAAATNGAGGSPSTSSSSSAPRPSLHLVVLGHVDAGKSSLMGRLLHELGVVSARDAHKYQRDAAAAGKGSFAWAWVLDERPEERERGVTVDVAMTRFNTRRFSVTLLDAPGHRDFVPNMIAGAAQADAALLLVDGSPGGFEAGFSEGTGGFHGTPGGQTREHAVLARSLGIEQMAVVISKLDTVAYDKARFDTIRAALLPYLKSVGFKESSLQWLPASGPFGENLVGPPQDPNLAAWWTSGLNVVAAINAFNPRERATSKPLRMPITDVFKSKTGAVVLGGKVEGGALKPGSKVVLVPGPSQHFSVRNLEASGSPTHLVRAGDSVEVALVAGHGGGAGGGGAIDPSNVPSGAVLCHPDFPAVLVTRFELRVVVLDVPVPLLRGHVVTLHAHVAREEGHITALLATLDPRTGDVVKSRPRCLTKGQTALVEVTAARGLVLEEYADYRALGRVALREGGRTLAVGIVTRLLE